MKLHYKYRKNVWWKRCTWRIGYSVDWRGENDDQLTFVFAGAWISLLKRVFNFFGQTLFKSYNIELDQSCVLRNGHVYNRLAVTIIDPFLDMASVDTMRLVIERRLHSEVRCDVVYFNDYEKFLNI